MPSAYCVWRTVWKPTLEISSQGMTVRKSVASTNPASPTASATSATAVSRCWDTRYSSAVMKISRNPGISRIAVM